MLPEQISTLIDELNKLPTIGRKSAQRLAFYLLRQSADDLRNLAEAVLGIREGVNFCEECFNLTSDKRCKICDNPSRDSSVVCVVEEVLDMIAIENTLEFNGVYHVLHGALSPLDNMGPEDLKLHELFERISKDKIKELILASSTNAEGEATALYIYEHIKDKDIKISRIATGLPVGGDLDYADQVTIKNAMKFRTSID